MVDSTIHAQIVNEPMESGSCHASMRMKTRFFFLLLMLLMPFVLTVFSFFVEEASFFSFCSSLVLFYRT